MKISELEIYYKNSHIKIPNWMKFAFELGTYISESGIKYKKPLNILISLPADHYFALFIAMGIADKFFLVKKQMRSIRKTILSLPKGSRIIYKDDVSSRKASVVSIAPSPVFENEMILNIKDGKITRGIPERHWMEKIILIDEEYEEIKRTRVIQKNQKLGLQDNHLLSSLYTPNQLNKASFYPGDKFYLVGNIKKVTESLSEKIFIHQNIRGSAGDFLYLNNKSSYTNGKLLSSQMKKNNLELDEGIPVIYSDLLSYLKQSKRFQNNPQIIISSRTDNESRIYEVNEDIKRKLLQGEHKILTNEIVDHCNAAGVNIPFGIEFIVWR